MMVLKQLDFPGFQAASTKRLKWSVHKILDGGSLCLPLVDYPLCRMMYMRVGVTVLCLLFGVVALLA
jgi:hypothetical protein